MSEEPEYVFKIVAVGQGGVGKTSLIRRWAYDKFDSSYVQTLGVDFSTKEIVASRSERVKLVCVDTAGQEYYGRIRPGYYSGANGAFIVFDLTNRNSFESLPKWVAELRKYLPEVPIAIVGNKLDLTEEEGVRRATKAEAEAFAAENGMSYFETSAKVGEGVDVVFVTLSEAVLARHREATA